MKYYIDTNNKPFEFEDNVTAEIIANVESIHNTALTEITETDYEAMAAPTFSGIQEAKINELKQAYTQANQEDLAYMDTTFQADKESQDLIVSVLSAGSVPDGFYWLDTVNNQVPMTYIELQGLSAKILSRGQVNFGKYQGLKIEVNSASTQEELDDIVW